MKVGAPLTLLALAGVFYTVNFAAAADLGERPGVAQEAIYLHLESKQVLWMNQSTGKVRSGDIVESAMSCGDDQKFQCLNFYDVHITIPEQFPPKGAYWSESGVCFRLAEIYSAIHFYQIQAWRSENCGSSEDRHENALILYTRKEGVIYFEEVRKAELGETGWIKISDRGVFARE